MVENRCAQLSEQVIEIYPEINDVLLDCVLNNKDM